MNDPNPSMIIASDYRIPNQTRVPPLSESRNAALARMGVHVVLVYTSTREPDRILVMISLRRREPVADVIRSRVFFDWFDAAGIDDIPAVFAGEFIERLQIAEPVGAPPGVLVSTIAAVDDVPQLIAKFRAAEDECAKAGIRKVWFFGASDDPREVMILQEVSDGERVKYWIDHPGAGTEWMASAGVGVYPTLFVGKLAQVIRIGETR